MTDGPGNLLLPEGTRLLHIGPHKTGTTSVQGAFHLARRSAAAQNVVYAGPNRHPLQAAQAAATASPDEWRRPSMRAWRRLLGDVRRAGSKRVVISSEWFADAPDENISQIVEDLDASRVHVVVTLRPLTSILASQWQQFVQGGTTTPYVDWLTSVFDQPNRRNATTFWRRHRHDRLVDRWAEVVGPSRLSVVVADDRDHSSVLRVFERLVGLADGTLHLAADRANRSLTRPEAELIRVMNGHLGSVGITGPAQLDLVLFGAAANLKARQPGTDEPRIETPDWAVERGRAVAHEIVAGIERSAVRVIGELGSLAAERATRAVEARAGAEPNRTTPWPEIAGAGAMGVLLAAGLARGSSAPPELDVFSSNRVRSVLAGRIRSALAGATALRSPSIHSTPVEVE